jgi:hypothetical protein
MEAVIIGLAISILWFALGVLAVLIAVYLLLKLIKLWAPEVIDSRVEMTIWVVVFILILIGAFTLMAGGHGSFRLGQFPAGIPSGTFAALSTAAA